MASSLAITAVTATGSILSVTGSGFVLLCYAILPLDRHFRHVLILSLTLSDFLNSLNNTVAGLYILARRNGLDPGWACTFNGFVGQATVQSTDCSVLAIAIATVWTIVKRESTSREIIWGPRQIVLVCCAIWALPFFTAFLGLGMKWYTPASGDWCWIQPKPAYLRYVLTHGWRYLFIAVEIILYIYLDIHLRRHYNHLSRALPRDLGKNPRLSELSAIVRRDMGARPPSGGPPVSTNSCGSDDRAGSVDSSTTLSTSTESQGKLSPPTKLPEAQSWSLGRITGLRGAQLPSSQSANPKYQEIQRVLLLNAYPLAYIILWIPGIINRSIEAAGKTSTLAQYFQASTQLVGLANAFTYGWNERVATRLRERFYTRGKQDSV